MSLPTPALGLAWTRARHATRIIRVLIAILAPLLGAVPIASALEAPSGHAASERLEVSRFTFQRLELPSAPDAVAFALDLEGERVTVRLRRSTLRAGAFRVLVQSGNGSLTEVVPPAAATYRGTIDGRPGSIVAGTIRRGRLDAALVLDDGRWFFVEPMAGAADDTDRGLHVVYRSDDAIAGSESCAAVGEAVLAPTPAGPRPESEGAALRIADIAFDTDLEFFQLNGGSVEATVQDIEAILAAVNIVFERDCAVTHRDTTIIVRTAEPDPYTATDAEALLGELRSHWNAAQGGIGRDLVHLMTGKDLDGSTVGYASIGAVCNTSRSYGLSRSRYSSNFSKRTTLTAHELGHNWSAVHCNSDPATSPCNVMCSTIAGCDGMGLPNFEPQGQAAISAFAASRSCLEVQALAVDGLPGAGGIRLDRPWPIPLRDRTTVSFHLDRSGPVRLDVHDLSGRRVACLVEADLAAGAHTVTWDGRDAAGRRVEPGVLFLRLAAGPAHRAQKLLVVR